MQKLTTKTTLSVVTIMAVAALLTGRYLVEQHQGAGTYSDSSLSSSENSSMHDHVPEPHGVHGVHGVSKSPAKTEMSAASSSAWLRANSEDQVRLDELNLAENLDDLVAEARENPAFAYALSMALNECMASNRSFSEVASGLEAGRLLPDQAESAVSALETRYKKCDGLTAPNVELQYDLVKSAADADVLDAQINYPLIASALLTSEAVLKRPGFDDEFKTNSVAFARRAASSGTPEGLFHAYNMFSNGVIVAPNLRSAYGYLYAYDRARPSQLSQLALNKLRQQMSEEDVQRAIAFSRSLSD